MPQISEILAAQRQYFNSNATKVIAGRIEALRLLRTCIERSEAELCSAIYNDFRKSPFETYGSELALLYMEIDEAIQSLHRWAAVKPVRTNLLNFPARSYIQPEPLGACLVIGAWNYPYLLSIAPAISALAAGNTVVIKPSELPSETASAMAKMINSAFPSHLLHVQEGDVQETTNILAQRWDKIFFTGSVRVGRVVYEAAAKHLTPVTLELGGKSPAFILPDADLKMAAKRLVFAKFLNAGQICVAPDYVMVHSSVKDRFIELVKAQIQKENPNIDAGNYVQIINTRNLERLKKLIDPAKVCFGGQIDEAQRTISPTLMDNVQFDDAVMQEEIFGPILPIITFDDFDEALRRVKKGEKPLAAYLFSTSSSIKKKFTTEFSFGGGCINDAVMHLSNPYLPYGGVGESGMGSYHGEYGFKAFSHMKSIMDKPNWLELNIKYAPHTSGKLALIKRIFRLG